MPRLKKNTRGNPGPIRRDHSKPKASKQYLRYLYLEAAQAIRGISEKEALELKILQAAFESAEISVAQLRKEPDLDESLSKLENYAQRLKNPPFAGDMGVGNSKAMAPRYYSKGAIIAAVIDVRSALSEAYVKLALAFADLSKSQFSEKQFRSEMESSLFRTYPEFYRLKGREAVWEAFLDNLRKHSLTFDPDTLSPADSFEGQFDSLDYIEMAQEFEDSFGIEISMEDLEDMEYTAGGLARLWERKLSPQKPPKPSTPKKRPRILKRFSKAFSK